MTTWLSRRAYGRTRNLSEAVVRRHIASGLLAPAVDPDTNLIDADLADQLLAAGVTRRLATKKVPAALQAAQMRHKRALARDLDDQVEELESSLLPPRRVEDYINNVAFAETNAVIAEWPKKIAPTLLGLTAYEAQRALKNGVEDLLADLYELVSRPRITGGKPAPKPKPDLDTMSAVELAAHVEHQRARLLELARAERQRRLVRVDDIIDANNAALVLSKQLLKAIPGRTDVFVAEAKKVDEIVAILDREVAGVVAAAHLDLSHLTKGALL